VDSLHRMVTGPDDNREHGALGADHRNRVPMPLPRSSQTIVCVVPASRRRGRLAPTPAVEVAELECVACGVQQFACRSERLPSRWESAVRSAHRRQVMPPGQATVLSTTVARSRQRSVISGITRPSERAASVRSVERPRPVSTPATHIVAVLSGWCARWPARGRRRHPRSQTAPPAP